MALNSDTSLASDTCLHQAPSQAPPTPCGGIDREDGPDLNDESAAPIPAETEACEQILHELRQTEDEQTRFRRSRRQSRHQRRSHPVGETP